MPARNSFTPAALRASQRLAAHAAITAGPFCPSARQQQSRGVSSMKRKEKQLGCPVLGCQTVVWSLAAELCGDRAFPQHCLEKTSLRAACITWCSGATAAENMHCDIKFCKRWSTGCDIITVPGAQAEVKQKLTQIGRPGDRSPALKTFTSWSASSPSSSVPTAAARLNVLHKPRH